MTGDSGLIIMTEDSIKIIRRVRGLRNEGVRAYYSMQTGPSVFVNTDERDQDKVLKAVERLGYRGYPSGVGGEATVL